MSKNTFSYCLLLLCVLWTLPALGSTSVTFPETWDVGQVFAAAISSHSTFEAPSIAWLERAVSLDVEPGREGHVAYALLGSHVRDVKPGLYPLEFSFTQDGERFVVKSTVRLKERKYSEEHLKVESKMVNPPKSETTRIQKEARLAAAARRTMTVKRLWTTPPERPVVGVVTSRYGFRRVYNGVPRNPHAGTDFRAPTGTPIKAPFAGKVVLTGFHYYSGGSVIIDSGNGVISLFFHMSEVSVKEGEEISKGQIVGKSGATGRVTGPHLHYALSLAGQYCDPEPLFSTSITQLLQNMKTTVIRGEERTP
ncbi:MAG: M23 family metallopeptidase [Synergistaceae bacterium]|jgi:murein DD-endopeptidase MepM/ murein hydrolase activator NlpD|nr:M23 family metallopeptidase [Synergistaceae bacterium]